MKNKSLKENLDPPISDHQETPAEHEEKVEIVHHWIDDVFTQEQERLKKDGICDAQTWVKAMASVDKALTDYPKETITLLARLYGITFETQDKKENYFPTLVPQVIMKRLTDLEQNQKNLWQALKEQSDQTKQLTISSFASAKDDKGNLLHPHFLIVKDEMLALLKSGVVFDYESAYEKALWINPQTRSFLLEKKEAENLQSLADEADKAKSAGFSPKGNLEKEDLSQLSTREILERTFKRLEG